MAKQLDIINKEKKILMTARQKEQVIYNGKRINWQETS